MTIDISGTHLRVALAYHTPIRTALYAALVCTDSEDKIDAYDPKEFLRKLVAAGHESVIEHISYTFVIEGISRAVLQEIARHRHISLSVQSTRWSLKKLLKSYTPPVICPSVDDWGRAVIVEEYKRQLEKIKYLLESCDGTDVDSVKYMLPESFPTKLVLTVNARELRHIFDLRTSPRALWEFQTLCAYMYTMLPSDHKFLYKDVVHQESLTKED